MKKLLLLFALLCGTVSAWAQTSLRISEGLLATQENTQYKWTSAELTAPTEGEFNKIRITFLKTSNNEKPAGFPCVALAEFYLYDKDGEMVELTEGNFSSNATQSDEGNMAAICNGITSGDINTYNWYWHSQWFGTPSPYGYHYLEINVAELDADLSKYKIGWVTRRAQASPADVIISTGATTEEAAKNANSQMLPEVSTDGVKLYTIKSVRTKNYLRYSEESTKPVQNSAVANESYWYFTQGTDGKVVMHNAVSGKVLGTNFEMATEGEWYVSPAEYRPGVVFSKTANISQNNCIDDQNGSIGSWSHNSGDNEGTTWLVEEVINAPVDVPVLSLNNLLISSIGNAVTTVEEGKWYILNNVGRGNYVSQEGNNWKMRATNNIAEGVMANEKAGYLFRITKNGEYYNIMSGNGRYFQLGRNTASTSATPVNFEIGLISEDNFYIFDKDHKYAADGQETDNAFVGWSTSVPTNAGGNDSYRILPVELLDVSEIFDLKKQLSEAIEAAQTKYNSVSIREGVNNYSVPEDFAERLATIAEFCESINGRTTTDDINTKIVDAQNLKAEIQINMPENGKFYRVRCAGYGMKYLQSTLDNSNENDIRLQVVSSATSVEATFCYNDGTLVSYTTGKSINAYRYNEVGTTSNVVFSEASNGKLGTYNINVGGRYIFGASDNNKIDSGTTRDNRDGYTWWLEVVTSLPFTFKAAALGYATFNAPVAVQLPEGVKAYTSEIQEGNKLMMTELAGGIVPANTAVLLWNESVADADVTVNLTITENVTFEGTNSFVGTVASENLNAEMDCYSLQKGTQGKVGFYAKSTGTKGGFKAWIEMAKSSEARAFVIIFDGEDATGIKEALGLENENVEIYDLSGRRLDKPAKGVNVIGGKTIIVR